MIEKHREYMQEIWQKWWNQEPITLGDERRYYTAKIELKANLEPSYKIARIVKSAVYQRDAIDFKLSGHDESFDNHVSGKLFVPGPPFLSMDNQEIEVLPGLPPDLKHLEGQL